jgi:ABC-type multidrug transport system fused ATPase/permease subunit
VSLAHPTRDELCVLGTEVDDQDGSAFGGHLAKGTGAATKPVRPDREVPLRWTLVRSLPLADPGQPDTRSPGRYLWWIAAGQPGSLLAGIAAGVVWMTGQAIAPALLGRAIDTGVAGRDRGQLLLWTGLLLGVAMVQAVAGVVRHRFAVTNWLVASFRTQQLVDRKVAELGASLPAQAPPGDIVTLTASDTMRIGGVFDVSARAAGAVVTFFLVAVLLLRSSLELGLIVLVGLPLLTLAIGPLLRPLQRRQLQQRMLLGRLTTLGSDTVAGLRVLRGVGGEETFLARFREQSQRVRAAGVEVARVQSVLDAAQVLLPGIFVVIVTWLGARFAVQGSLSIGELVAFYGYAAFLATPLRTATEAAEKVSNGLVSAGRVLAVLRLGPLLPPPPAGSSTEPAAWSCTLACCSGSPARLPRSQQRWPTGSGATATSPTPR